MLRQERLNRIQRTTQAATLAAESTAARVNTFHWFKKHNADIRHRRKAAFGRAR